MTPEEIAALQPFDVEKIHDFTAFLKECETHSITPHMYHHIWTHLNLMMKELMDAGLEKIDPKISTAGWKANDSDEIRLGHMLTISTLDGEILMGFAFGMSADNKVIEKFSRLNAEELVALVRPPRNMMN